MQKEHNTCGIISLCVGWLIPIAGITLAILALTGKEKTKEIGIIGLTEALFAWFIWTVVRLN